MPSIGFGDEEVKKELTEEQIDQRSEEIKKAQSVMPEREHFKFSKRRIAELHAIYSETVVHDYGDTYHKSKEELREQNQFYELYQKINGKKRNYRKINEYIIAYRNCLNFLYAVAEKQQVYEVDEFIERFCKGKIRINGMYLPVYKGKDRKRISQKALMEYIMSDGDPNKFLDSDPMPEITSREALDEMRKNVFTRSQYERVMEHAFDTDEDYQDTEDTMIDPDDPRTYQGKPVAVDMTREEQKKLFGKNPGLAQIVKDTCASESRVARSTRRYSSEYVSDFESEDLEAIDKYSRAYGVHVMDDIPQFKGSLLNKKDFKKYMQAMRDWEFKNTRIKVDGKYRTLEEENDLKVKEVLEKDDVNIRMLWSNEEEDRKIRSYLKKSKEKEKELREKLAKVEELNKGKDKHNRSLSDAEKYRRLKAYDEDEKKKRRAKGKASKKDKKAAKALKTGVKKKKKKVDPFILGVTGNGDKSMKEYKRENLDFTAKGFKKFQEDN